jgi:hypothetical protein
MKKYYKNNIDFSLEQSPSDRIKEISNEIVKHSDYLPKTLSYKDIDYSIKKWVEDKITIIQDGVKLPTMVLYSNQRFSEYIQSWKFTDENNNIRLNFKTVTRDSNPTHGTILGDTYNIPGERFYTFKSVNAIDESGKKYRIDYKMKQPTPVDLIYKISIMTNRYASINEFNEIVNNLFKSKQQYICPNGHYMSLTMESINDESEYNIEDRQFFSQTIVIKVKGYIIREEDLIVEENPLAMVLCFEGDDSKYGKPSVEVFEYEPIQSSDAQYLIKNIDIDIDLYGRYPYKGKIKFTMDDNLYLTSIEFKNQHNLNEESVKLYINGNLITENLKSFLCENEIIINMYDEIVLYTQQEKKHIKSTGFVLSGYDKITSSVF